MRAPPALAVLATLLLPGALSLECSHTCYGVPTMGTGFCLSRLAGMDVCTGGSTFGDLDRAARDTVETLLKSNTSLSTRCGTLLHRFHCMRQFPICELGREHALLCQSTCDDVVAACAGDFPAVTLEALGCVGVAAGLDGGVHCYGLGYTGPNRWLWLIGFLINVVFSFLAALGINLQKHSLRLHEGDVPKVSPFRQKYWALGFLLILSGSILDFIAFGLAPQSFLAPLAALSLVWNMLLAPRFHGETITRQNVIATIVICVGVTSSVVFSSHGTPTYLLSDLLLLYQKTAMYAYVVVVALFLTFLYTTAKRIEREKLNAGLLHIVCYGGLGGTFGGQSVTLAKSTIELVKSSLAGGDAFVHFETYIIVVAMTFCLLAQITFLNEGLRRFDALLVVPVYQAFWIIVSILGGLVYFEEYKTLDTLELAMFVVGSLITLAGIMYLLSQRTEPAMATSASRGTMVRRRRSRAASRQDGGVLDGSGESADEEGDVERRGLLRAPTPDMFDAGSRPPAVLRRAGKVQSDDGASARAVDNSGSHDTPALPPSAVGSGRPGSNALSKH